MLLPLYMRREPTTDPVLKHYAASVPKTGRYDVVAYRDPTCTQRAARWNWFATRPRMNCARVTFNCYNWRAVWI